MATVSGSAQINKPLAEVFSFMTDSTNWPKVEEDLVEVAPKGRLQKGSKGTETRKMGGRTIKATWDVTEFEANKKFTVAGAGPGMKVSAVTTFAAKNGGTDVTFSMDYKTQGILMMLMSPMIKGQPK